MFFRPVSGKQGSCHYFVSFLKKLSGLLILTGISRYSEGREAMVSDRADSAEVNMDINDHRRALKENFVKLLEEEGDELASHPAVFSQPKADIQSGMAPRKPQ